MPSKIVPFCVVSWAIACGSPVRTDRAQPGAMPAVAMEGPFATLDEWCKPRAAQARANGEEDFRCADPEAEVWSVRGRCEDHQCCEGHEGKPCPFVDLGDGVANQDGSAKAMLVSVRHGPQAECFLGLETAGGFYVAKASQDCRTVGVRN